MARWSTEDSRRQAGKMTMRGTLTDEAYEGLTPEERRMLMKEARAQRYSGIGGYPSTMGAVSEGLLTALDENGLLELWDAMDYRQQGAMYVAFKCGYDAGRSDAS